MAAAAYRHLARQWEDPDLFRNADLLRETMATPGWTFVLDAIAEHERRMVAQLLNETTRAEEIPRLRGLVSGLRAMSEAADSILSLAVEREQEARKRAKAQETANV
jgi:hypothetical protein